jgi:hypothetical protein
MATIVAKKLLPRYMSAYAEVHTMPGFGQMQTPEHIAHQRKVILGHWRPKTNW